jgi:glycosyltransferase involved in cell wall biosynthesis
MAEAALKAPFVSVCIPTYNCARYLGEAIESVLSQSFADYELVVVDNASTDSTPELCARYRDPRVRYLRFDTLVGQAANWNRCLDLATGDLVVLLHADDLLRPAYLERAVTALANCPKAGLVHCAVQHISADGRPLRLQRLFEADTVVAGEDSFRRLLLNGCLVSPAGVMVRRTLYQAAGRFATEVVWAVDWHMWLRLSLLADVAYLAEPLAAYREHPLSGTAGVLAEARNGPDERWALEDALKRVPEAKSMLRGLRRPARRQLAQRTWAWAEECCRQRMTRAARRGLWRASAMWPPLLLTSRFWGLWLGTLLGYERFAQLHAWKKRLSAWVSPQPR